MDEDNKPVLVDSNVRIPSDTYKWIILSSEYKVSQRSGNPMFELELELIEAKNVRIKTDIYDINGLKSRMYIVMSDKNKSNVSKFMAKLGLNTSPSAEDAPKLTGKKLLIFTTNEEVPRQREVYNEAGELVKEDALDDEGKPLTYWRAKVDMGNVIKCFNPGEAPQGF